MPCESIPARLVETRDLVTCSEIPDGTPTAFSKLLTKLINSFCLYKCSGFIIIFIQLLKLFFQIAYYI